MSLGVAKAICCARFHVLCHGHFGRHPVVRTTIRVVLQAQWYFNGIKLVDVHLATVDKRFSVAEKRRFESTASAAEDAFVRSMVLFIMNLGPWISWNWIVERWLSQARQGKAVEQIV